MKSMLQQIKINIPVVMGDFNINVHKCDTNTSSFDERDIQRYTAHNI